MTSRRFLQLAACYPGGALLALAGTAAGQEIDPGGPALVTDRPDFTESALTVPTGHLQAELGYTFARSEEATRHAVGEVLLRIGLSNGLEGRAGINSFVVLNESGSTVEGLEDLTLGAKISLIRSESSAPADPDVALLASVSFPTGDDEIGSDGVEPGAVLAAGWTIGERLSVGANAGWTLARSDPDDLHQLSASVSLGTSIADRLGAFLEYFALVPVSGGSDTSHFVDGGLTLLLGPELQLDGRIGIGVESHHPDYFAGVGLTFRM